MKLSFVILAVGALTFVACEEKSGEPKPDDPTASKNATTGAATGETPTPAAAPPAVIAESDLSTPADFEEAAEKTISKTTYKSELALLETDITKE